MATDARQFLGKAVTVTVDRPLGSAHPKYGWAYPVNYGFVPNTISPDGEELDAYILGVEQPLQDFRGVCVAVIHRTNDDDDKLVVVPEGTKLTEDQIRQATDFQEQHFESALVMATEHHGQ